VHIDDVIASIALASLAGTIFCALVTLVAMPAAAEPRRAE
jgi:hypothetical protein